MQNRVSQQRIGVVGTLLALGLWATTPHSPAQYFNPNSAINSLRPSFAQQAEQQMIQETLRQQQLQQMRPEKIQQKDQSETKSERKARKAAQKNKKPDATQDVQTSTTQQESEKDPQLQLKETPQNADSASESTKAPQTSSEKPVKVHIPGLNLAEHTPPLAVIDKTGQLVIAPKSYRSIAAFSHGLACVLSDDNPPLFGYINAKGQWAIVPKYQMAGDFKPVGEKIAIGAESSKPVRKDKSSQVLARVALDNHWGFISQNGDIAVPLVYDWVGEFSEGLAPFRQGNRFGYLDPQGEVVIQPQYEEAGMFSEGLAKVVLPGKINSLGVKIYTFITPQGEVAFETGDYDRISDFRNGLATVGRYSVDIETARKENREPDQYGYIDRSGKLTIPMQYAAAWPFQGDIALVKLSPEQPNTLSATKTPRESDKEKNTITGVYAFIDRKGKLVYHHQGPWADEFQEGYAPVKTTEGYGYINKKGKLVIQAGFAWAGHFHEGLAPVAVLDAQGRQRYGFINTFGQFVVPPKYTWVKPFSDGLAQVQVR